MTNLHEVTAPGIGDVHFASPEWVDIAREEMARLVQVHPLPGRNFTLCEVGHNAPAYLHAGASLAWHARIEDGEIEIAAGELPAQACDMKMECDHAILSNIARVEYAGNDEAAVSSVIARLSALTRWQQHGNLPADADLQALFRRFHDVMAPHTMPRFVWMSEDWVEIVRRFLLARAESDKYREGLKGVNYLFAEEFHETPRYAFPAGEVAGFWVECRDGTLTVGSGALPDAATRADALTRGLYNAVIPAGRTVEAAMTEADREALEQYTRVAFRFDKLRNARPVEQTSPTGAGEMPKALARVFAPLHDEISKRTSGELPGDYGADHNGTHESEALSFDRQEGYDASWLRYDKVNIYGQPL